MNQPQPKPFFQKLNLLAVGLSLVTACTTHPSALPDRTYFAGTVSMSTPASWVNHALPDFWRYDPRDTVSTILIGSKDREAQLTLRQQEHIRIENLTTHLILDAYYKSSATAKILSVTTDSINNKVVVNFLAGYQSHTRPLLYFSDVTIVQGRKWLHVEFRGPNTMSFRDSVRQMERSIKLNGGVPIQSK